MMFSFHVKKLSRLVSPPRLFEEAEVVKLLNLSVKM